MQPVSCLGCYKRAISIPQHTYLYPLVNGVLTLLISSKGLCPSGASDGEERAVSDNEEV